MRTLWVAQLEDGQVSGDAGVVREVRGTNEVYQAGGCRGITAGMQQYLEEADLSEELLG